MHYIWILTLITCALFGADKTFCIAIQSYNNAEWVQKNLRSVFSQSYQNFHVIYVSDGSTDGTDKIAQNYVESLGKEDQFTLLINDERQSPLACMCKIAQICSPEEIIVDLDGNDWLANNLVLKRLNQVYQDDAVWMTYGQFMRYPGYGEGFAHQVPQEIIDTCSFRNHGGAVTHLKTFYASLFQQIDKSSFLFEGNFIQRAGDMAYTIPILEMAGMHSQFIPHTLYVYNESTPIHPDKEPSYLEEEMDRFVRSQAPLKPVSSLLKDNTPSIYSQLNNPNNLTIDDYHFIQDYLSFGKRDKLPLLQDMAPRARSIKIIGDTPKEFPKSGTIPVNCSLDEKENCILVYASFNDKYPDGLLRLIEHIENSDFKGHILYRIGGWPNIEGGGITLAHIPYGFKIAFFQEALRLGYKRALYLDTAVVPLAPLNAIFDQVADKGYFVMGNAHMVGPYINKEAASFFGLNHLATFQIPSCSAGLLGLDLICAKSRKALEWWDKAARDSDAFYSARSDQNALSIILHNLGMREFTPLSKMPHSASEIQSDSLFLLDRWYVH